MLFSLSSTSDDNLLKNIELFDKLSLRFSGRVLFIKDVIGSSEICCWSFYGHGKKVAEVCCTSIVYATDKKHTKVVFKVYCNQTLLCSKAWSGSFHCSDGKLAAALPECVVSSCSCIKFCCRQSR